MKVSPMTLPCIMPITWRSAAPRVSARGFGPRCVARAARGAHLQVAARAAVHRHLHQRQRRDAHAACGAPRERAQRGRSLSSTALLCAAAGAHCLKKCGLSRHGFCWSMARCSCASYLNSASVSASRGCTAFSSSKVARAVAAPDMAPETLSRRLLRRSRRCGLGARRVCGVHVSAARRFRVWPSVKAQVRPSRVAPASPSEAMEALGSAALASRHCGAAPRLRCARRHAAPRRVAGAATVCAAASRPDHEVMGMYIYGARARISSARFVSLR